MSASFSKVGDQLELRAAAYFQAHGYFVRRGVMLSVAAGTADATDIDLLAIRFSVPLTEERLVADCKDKRKPKPFERILWTRGLASFANATQAVVILPRSVWQAREFATQGGVEILESFEIERFMKTVASSYTPYSDAHPEISYKRRQNDSRELGREDLRLRQMLVIGHPLTNLNRIVKSLSNIGKSASQEGNSFWMTRCVLFNAAVVASVMLVRFAAESKWTPEKDWSAYARKKLTFGDVSPAKALQLAQFALDRKIIEGIPAPAYTGEVIQLIKVLINNPRLAARIPNALDQYLFDQVLAARPRVLDHASETDEEALSRLAKRVLSALSYAAGIPAAIWQIEKRPKESTQRKVAGNTVNEKIPQLILGSNDHD